MEKTIVLENLDDTSATWLEQEAERRSLPVEQVALELIQQAIKDAQLETYHDPDDLAGTWSDEEADEFLRAIADLEVTIPAQWGRKLSIDQDELRQVLMLGLAQLRQQREDQDVAQRVVQVLLSTGRVRRLPSVPNDDGLVAERRKPLKLPGMPLSEILIAQRRGEL
jgi:hypothetical protein